MYYLFQKVYSENGLRAYYSEVERDLLEGEVAKNHYPNVETQKAYSRRFGVDVNAIRVSEDINYHS